MVKLADTQDLGSCAVTGVQVQVLFWANKKLLPFEGVFFCPERKPTVGLSSGLETPLLPPFMPFLILRNFQPVPSNASFM